MSAPSAPLVKLWDGSYLARMLPDGQQVASHKTFLFGDAFEGSALESWWTQSTTGSGSVSVLSGAAGVSTGTTANSTAKLASALLPAYQPGLPLSFFAVVRLDSSAGTAAGNAVQFGLYSGTDGYGCKIVGGIIKARYFSFGSEQLVTLNGPGNPVVDTNPHAYEIIAYGNVALLLQDGALLHTFNVGGLGGSKSLNLPPTFECINSGGSTTLCQLYVFETSVCRYGGDLSPVYLTKRISTNTTTVLKSSPGLLRGLLIGVTGNGSSVQVYDNTVGSGTLLFSASTTVVNYLGPLEIPFYTGLTFVTAGTGAAELQVTWR